MTIQVVGRPPAEPGFGWLNVVTDPRVAITMNSSADQGAKLQTALDLAGASQADSCVYIPPGFIKCRQQLEWPTTRCVRLVGSGGGDRHASSVSSIWWDTDLGAGTYALDLNLTSYPYQIDDICFEGPGITPAAGQLPCLMMGVKDNTRGTMNRVRITAFNSAVYVQNDHQEWRSCDFRGNGIAMNFGENGNGGLGDLVVDRCYLTDCSRASFAVSNTNTLANMVATQGHAGAAPFGVWRYPSPGTACAYSGSGSQLTGVAMDWTAPANGIIIEGTNIQPGTTLSSFTGSLGNYTFNLSLAPTGPVSNIVIARRGTAMAGCEFTNWSWEGCHHAVLYDDAGTQGFGWGSYQNLHFTTNDSSTFAYQAWQQVVAGTGSNGQFTISGVAVSDFTPTKGMMVTGTNVGTGAKITAVSGSSGNYTLTVDVANSGAVSGVTVKQPTDLAVYEVGTCLNWEFSNGTPPTIAFPGHPCIRANSIRCVHFGDAIGARNNITDAPTTARPFVIRTAYSSTSEVAEDLSFGGSRDSGGLRLAALVTDDALAVGELVEPSNLGHVRKSLGTSVPLGHVVGTWTQGEVAVFVVSTPSHSATRAKNTSASTISNGALIKADTGGGIKTATSIADGPIVGHAREAITAGSLGQVWARY